MLEPEGAACLVCGRPQPRMASIAPQQLASAHPTGVKVEQKGISIEKATSCTESSNERAN